MSLFVLRQPDVVILEMDSGSPRMKAFVAIENKDGSRFVYEVAGKPKRRTELPDRLKQYWPETEQATR